MITEQATQYLRGLFAQGSNCGQRRRSRRKGSLNSIYLAREDCAMQCKKIRLWIWLHWWQPSSPPKLCSALMLTLATSTGAGRHQAVGPTRREYPWQLAHAPSLLPSLARVSETACHWVDSATPGAPSGSGCGRWDGLLLLLWLIFWVQSACMVFWDQA